MPSPPQTTTKGGGRGIERSEKEWVIGEKEGRRRNHRRSVTFFSFVCKQIVKKIITFHPGCCAIKGRESRWEANSRMQAWVSRVNRRMFER